MGRMVIECRHFKFKGESPMKDICLNCININTCDKSSVIKTENGVVAECLACVSYVPNKKEVIQCAKPKGS